MTDEASLRIVNGILLTLGQATTSTLETEHPDVVQAQTLLDVQNFQFQSVGWTFNTDTDITLVADVGGFVAIPATALDFKITACVLQYLPSTEKARYTRRGNLVYDTILHTSVLSLDIRADIVTQLDIGDLPPVAQTYLGALCNEQANLGDDGDMAKQAKLEQFRMTAWANFHAAELKAIAINALDSPQAQKLRSRYTGFGLGVNPLNPGG